MVASVQKIEELLQSGVESLGYELVCVELLQHRHAVLRLYVDAPDGIGIEDCEAVSRYASGVLDVNDPVAGNYVLEVSSPGADRPLVTAEHYLRYRGEEARVQLRRPLGGSKNFRGVIVDIVDDDLLLEVDGEKITLPLPLIRRARLVPSFFEAGVH
ncbi:MAG: ribosome maturation factor RimP [Immundisolibacteraceae bacterium]|jgi:ribosome maturation factor RimP|nr:ribosome maturation factor RimP [Immundisolibacteraceae bacterium]